MAFYDWISSPVAGTNVLSENDFNSDAQRTGGFTSGTPASSLRVNTALRQANLVAVALMKALGLNTSSYSFMTHSDIISMQIGNYFSAREVEANPSPAGTTPLTGLRIGSTKFVVSGGGTSVTPNPDLTGVTNVLTGVDFSGTKYKVPQGVEQTSGNGNVYDYGISQNIGTYKYVLTGKQVTITFSFPNSIASVDLNAELIDFPNVSIDKQRFGYVYNIYDDPTEDYLNVYFFKSSSKFFIAATNGGVGYNSELEKLDQATFTLLIN